jgi:hypothetical protein
MQGREKRFLLIPEDDLRGFDQRSGLDVVRESAL